MFSQFNSVKTNTNASHLLPLSTQCDGHCDCYRYERFWYKWYKCHPMYFGLKDTNIYKGLFYPCSSNEKKSRIKRIFLICWPMFYVFNIFILFHENLKLKNNPTTKKKGNYKKKLTAAGVESKGTVSFIMNSEFTLPLLKWKLYLRIQIRVSFEHVRIKVKGKKVLPPAGKLGCQNITRNHR